jgi:hypothetical protein
MKSMAPTAQVSEAMCVSDIEKRISEIQTYIDAGDLATADVLERCLHLDVLGEIKYGNPAAQQLAAKAIETGMLAFERPFVQFATLTQEQQKALFAILYKPHAKRDIALQRLVRALPLLLQGLH